MSRKTALGLVWALVALCYLAPYLLLRNVNAWYGSFLFYTIVGVLVIALNLWATRDFGKGDAP